MATPSGSALRALALELKGLQEDPLEGIRSRLLHEDNLFEWEVALFGPPDTLYQGGYFKVSEFISEPEQDNYFCFSHCFFIRRDIFCIF